MAIGCVSDFDLCVRRMDRLWEMVLKSNKTQPSVSGCSSSGRSISGLKLSDRQTDRQTRSVLKWRQFSSVTAAEFQSPLKSQGRIMGNKWCASCKSQSRLTQNPVGLSYSWKALSKSDDKHNAAYYYAGNA